MTNYERYLAVNTAYDGLLDSGVAAAADHALKSVDAETGMLFRKYGLRMPGDFALMSWKRTAPAI